MILLLRSIMKNQRGQAMVELALITPIILIMLMGIVEFGRIYSAQLIINHAVREGARLAAVEQTDIQIRGAVKTSCNNNGIVITDSDITIDPDDTPPRAAGSSVDVSAKYKVQLFAPIVKQAFGVKDENDKFHREVTAKVTMRVE